MKKASKKTKATVCIVESLNFFDEDNHKEGEIISRTLRLSGKASHYSYIRTRKEFQALLKEFKDSKHRYLHISCHGNVGTFFLTTEEISSKKFAALLAPNVKNRRIFLSTCLATDNEFAKALLSKSKCHSVLGPAEKIDMDDAAVFWIAFYHLMFNFDRNKMKRSTIIETVEVCSKLVKAKFRFFYMDGGTLQEKVIGD